MKAKKNMDKFFYNIEDDLKAFPDAIIYVIFGGRHTGKTYSCLRHYKRENQEFVYARRTDNDVQLLCSGKSRNVRDLGIEFNINPFVPLNINEGWNVNAFPVNKFMGVFQECDNEGKPTEEDISGYIMSIHSCGKIRGAEFPKTKALIFDEMVASAGTVVYQNEGECLLSLFETINRAREANGEDSCKLICLSNADNVICPTTRTLEILDALAELKGKKEGVVYLKERGIVVRKIKTSKEFDEFTTNTKIAKAMKGTAWYDTNVLNEFANNDFTKIGSVQLKYSKPLCSFTYHRRRWYVYYNESSDKYFVCANAFSAKRPYYDLSIDSDCIAFEDTRFDMWDAVGRGALRVESVEVYDLIMNYRKIIKV